MKALSHFLFVESGTMPLLSLAVNGVEHHVTSCLSGPTARECLSNTMSLPVDGVTAAC